MADNMLEGTFSFEAGFAPQPPGFSHNSGKWLVTCLNKSDGKGVKLYAKPCLNLERCDMQVKKELTAS